MKRLLMLVAVIALCVMMTGCDSIVKAMHPGEVQVAGAWVKQSEVDKYNFKSMSSIEAEIKGDTYCEKCEKVNPGKVRICKYCGQYI